MCAGRTIHVRIPPSMPMFIATPKHAHERQNARKYTQKHTQIHTKVHYHTVGCEGSVVPGPQYHHGRSCGRAGHQEEGGVGESGRSTTPTRPPNGRSDSRSSVRVHQRPATDAGPGPAPTSPGRGGRRRGSWLIRPGGVCGSARSATSRRPPNRRGSQSE